MGFFFFLNFSPSCFLPYRDQEEAARISRTQPANRPRPTGAVTVAATRPQVAGSLAMSQE